MARYSRKALMGTRILGGGVMFLTLALGGCDCDHRRCGGPFATGITTAGVSRAAAPVVVFISPSLFGPAVFVAGVTSPIIDIRVEASTTVDLDQVTIHMIDGTNLGGPMVTVPRADLVGQFGSTRILGGAIRTFRFHPRFEWKNPPRSVAADVTVKDSRGVAHSVTAESPWP
jgi:hypothetical protein